MRYNYLLTSIAFALASGLGLPAPAGAQVFGSVTAIGGSASDIALDETRGLLYILGVRELPPGAIATRRRRRTPSAMKFSQGCSVS